MEFRDLKKQYSVLKKDIDEAILEVLNETNFISGKQVTALEKSLAEYVGVKHCISCANGTDALSLVLMSWNIGRGDAVFVPDFTFFATAEVVLYEGATPIFVDVYEDTLNMDIDKLERAIKKVKQEGKLTPKVIIPVDLFGQPADYEKIEEVAKKYEIRVLEDGAQGFGGEIRGRRACSFGDAGTTSFFPAKPLGGYGDGGAVFTNDDRLAELIRSYCIHGKGSFKYDNVRIGINSRLDTMQAAILNIKFKAFKEYEIEAVNVVADIYTHELKNLMIIPYINEGYRSSWAQYVIRLDNETQRNALRNYLAGKNIPTMIYYPKPIHLQTAFFEQLFAVEDLAVSEHLSKVVLALPIHPYMEKEDVVKITDEIKKWLGSNNE